MNYHRIRHDGGNSYTPFDDNVFGLTAAEFRKQLRWLKENVDLVSEEELIRDLKGQRRGKRLSVLITFDDGYRDNYTIAYPIMQEMGIPGIFFIPYDIIEQRSLGWWDLIAYVIKNCGKESIKFEGRDIRFDKHRSYWVTYFQELAKTQSKSRIESMIQVLSNSCEVSLPGPEVQGAELMTWDQIREIAGADNAIGSHTNNHPVLANEDRQTQEEEIKRSKELIEHKIGREVRSIAYPVGNIQHFNEDSVALAKESGYHIGFSYKTGCNVWGRIDPYRIRRISAPSKAHMLFPVIAFAALFA